MRFQFRFAALPLMVAAVASCSQAKPSGTTSPTPAPGAGAAAAPAGGRATGAGTQATPPASVAQGRGGPPGAGGAPGGGRGGPPMTPEQRAARRDSIGTLRAAMTAQLMKEIAGHETEPAGTVFKNVQLLKDMPAGQFLTLMDQGIGKGVGHNCTDCHIANQWASDSLNRKKTARIMIDMVGHINNDLLSKLPVRAGQAAPKIACVTCHRGNPGGPGVALMP